MTKIDCVWIAAAALAYDACLEKDNWTLDDVFFSQQDIVSFAKKMIGDEIPNALVSQHACAYSNSQNRNCMYLVADGVKRRISYSGEFAGKTERPDFSEMKNNISITTKQGNINIDELLKFVDEVYSPRMKKLLEQYFSKYDLGSVFDFIGEYEGKIFTAVEKAGSEASAMELYKQLGSAARTCVKEFSEEIKKCMPRYEKTDISGWINQGQRTTEYIWAQLRMKAKADLPTSMSVFFERIRDKSQNKKFELRISVEAQDSKCVKDEQSSAEEKYYRHARLLNVEKKAGLDYFVGGSLPDQLVISDKSAQEIMDDIHTSKNKKVQICKVMSEDDVRSKSAYEVYQFMIESVYELEPYYNAAVEDEKENKWWPSLDEYNPGITAEQYEQILSDESKVKRELLDTLYYLFIMGGYGTCKQIADRYGNSFGHYNANARTVAKIVQSETECPVRQRDEGGDSYWPVLFYGRDAGKEEQGTFVWKIREPLKEAIENMVSKGVLKMANGEKIKNLNMILYGPPGTGKTYNSVVYAVAICEEKSVEEVADEDYEVVKARYEKLKSAGRIAFTTFHQSYGYEEFIEGIRPVMSNENTDLESSNGSQLNYRVEPGVFKKFCDDAKKIEVKTDKFDFDKDAIIWKVTVRPEVREDCFKNKRVRIDWGMDSEGAYGFVNDMKKGDLILTTDGSRSIINGIAVVTSEDAFELEGVEEDRTTRNVTWLATDISEDIKSINAGKMLHRMTCARVPKMAVSDAVSLAMKKNTNLIGTEIEENRKPYVFIIDEINRGNISKIFGELITLIEDTKRLGMDEQASAILPYSGEEFSVPANVYILGTMNTADRSIALMDTALRRRFSFVEKMPEAGLLNGVNVYQAGESINIGNMLYTINQRIEFLFDREHTIGHAFFMKLKKDPSIAVLADIFKKSVIPLLQEYFYEDYEKIQLVLGDNGKPDNKYKFIINETVTPSSIFRGRSRLEKTEKYTINEDAFQYIDSYIGILKQVDEGQKVNDEE